MVLKLVDNTVYFQIEIEVILEPPGDFLAGMKHSSVVFAVELLGNFGGTEIGHPLAQVHGHLPGFGNDSVSFLGAKSVPGDTELGTDNFENVFNADKVDFLLENIFQHFFSQFPIYISFISIGKVLKVMQRALQQADIAFYLFGDEHQDFFRDEQLA